MKKLTLSKIFFFLIFIFSFPMISYERANNIGFRNLRIKPIETKRVVRVPQKVVIGMIQVESNGNDSAYNKSERGCWLFTDKTYYGKRSKSYFKKTRKRNIGLK